MFFCSCSTASVGWGRTVQLNLRFSALRVRVHRDQASMAIKKLNSSREEEEDCKKQLDELKRR